MASEAKSARELRATLNQRHEGLEQVGKENREQEDDENTSSSVNESWYQAEQRNCPEYASRAPIEEAHLYPRSTHDLQSRALSLAQSAERDEGISHGRFHRSG